MKIVTVVGARPQFIKAGPISRRLRLEHEEILVHTGQHYDANMSEVFFEELEIPRPDHNLGIGSGPHGAQTGAMLEGIERVIGEHRPDRVMVYGDTNSTLAGALAAAKLQVPVAHVEAGLRSFNRRMPEEINRVLTDHVSDLLFCPSETAVLQLANEGITRGVHLTGDVMADVLGGAVERARARSTILRDLALEERRYVLATVHRAENTDDPSRLRRILSAFETVGEVVVFPVHPRTRRLLGAATGSSHGGGRLRFIDPVGYLDMIRLTSSARLVLTDSGGLQKEAYWLSVPCVTLREETEWVETVAVGWNVLAGSDPERILQAVHTLVPPARHPALYGDGNAAAAIADALNGAGVARAGP
jgi:UDP-N-acetylglucosamine 2-epimerase